MLWKTDLAWTPPPGQFDSTGGRDLESWFTRFTASSARRESEYLARGADVDSSEYTPTTVKRPLNSPITALENRPDRISEAMFCCHSWVSANFVVMASLLGKSEEDLSLAIRSAGRCSL
jgi:hypothetical protein